MKVLKAVALSGALLAATFAGGAAGADRDPFVFRTPERPIGVFMSHPTFVLPGSGPAFRFVPPALVGAAQALCNVHARVDATAMQPGPRHYCDAAQAFYPQVQECPAGWRELLLPPPQ